MIETLFSEEVQSAIQCVKKQPLPTPFWEYEALSVLLGQIIKAMDPNKTQRSGLDEHIDDPRERVRRQKETLEEWLKTVSDSGGIAKKEGLVVNTSSSSLEARGFQLFGNQIESPVLRNMNLYLFCDGSGLGITEVLLSSVNGDESIQWDFYQNDDNDFFGLSTKEQEEMTGWIKRVERNNKNNTDEIVKWAETLGCGFPKPLTQMQFACYQEPHGVQHRRASIVYTQPLRENATLMMTCESPEEGEDGVLIEKQEKILWEWQTPGKLLTVLDCAQWQQWNQTAFKTRQEAQASLTDLVLMTVSKEPHTVFDDQRSRNGSWEAITMENLPDQIVWGEAWVKTNQEVYDDQNNPLGSKQEWESEAKCQWLVQVRGSLCGINEQGEKVLVFRNRESQEMLELILQQTQLKLSLLPEQKEENASALKSARTRKL